MSSSDNNIAKRRAVIYLRVSTNDQLKTDFDADGFSIRAQREMCVRKAAELGAVVVDEYVDRGESAKSADRPRLQEMLARLRSEGDVDFVIVHKVDRLARSREDDMAIVIAIRKAGAQLVSATENIDETPQASCCMASWPPSPSSTPLTWPPSPRRECCRRPRAVARLTWRRWAT